MEAGIVYFTLYVIRVLNVHVRRFCDDLRHFVCYFTTVSCLRVSLRKKMRKAKPMFELLPGSRPPPFEVDRSQIRTVHCALNGEILRIVRRFRFLKQPIDRRLSS